MNRYRIVRGFETKTYDNELIPECMPQRRVGWFIFKRWQNLLPNYTKSFLKAQHVIDLMMNHGFGEEDMIFYEKPNNKVVTEPK